MRHTAGTKLRRNWFLVVCLTPMILGASGFSQTCLSAADMTVPMRSALELASRHYFDLSARGDVAALRQSSVPALAGNFSGVEAAVKDNAADFAGARAIARPPFLLTADGPQPLPRAEFLCGIFGKTGQTATAPSLC